MPRLYVVATPIGNLEDIAPRALRVLGAVGCIAAEDTRVTRKLLARYGITTPLVSFHEHNASARMPQILAALREGDVALVSDAGTPGVSDPGAALVAAAAEAGAETVAVPGPSAVAAAVSVSGLPGDRFRFIGWPPRRSAELRRALDALAGEQDTLVALESPRRLRATLTAMLAAWGDRRVAVCRELTKLHEETWHGSLSRAVAHFTAPRGEFTLVVAGAPPNAQRQAVDETRRADARQRLALLRGEGRTARDAVALVTAETGLPRRAVYALWLETAPRR